MGKKLIQLKLGKKEGKLSGEGSDSVTRDRTTKKAIDAKRKNLLSPPEN